MLTGHDPSQTASFLASLLRLARQAPERPAIIHYRGEFQTILSRQDVIDSLSAVRTHLDERVHGSGGVVAIMLKHEVIQYPLYLGVIAAGLIPAFLAYPTSKQDPDRYWAAQTGILQHLRPRLVIGYREIADRLRPIAASLGAELLLSDELPTTTLQSTAWAPPPVSPDQILLLQHSSGTTGAHKGVAVTHGRATAQALAYAEAVALDETSTVVSWLPPYHDMGLFSGFLIPMSVGAAVVSIDPFEWVARPAVLLEAIESFHGTHCWMPNFAFGHLASAVPADARFDLSALVALVSCSEVVKARTLETFLARFGDCGVRADQICACYAMAEAAFAVTQTPTGSGCTTRWYDVEALEHDGRAVARDTGEKGGRALVSNGSPLGGLEVRILSPAASDAAETAAGLPVGEIAIQGVCVFEGYFENPDATRPAFDEGWFRTGDIGFLDRGELFITGRAKDILIVNGRNYYAHDIETIVSSVPGVVPGRAAAISLDHENAQSEDAVVIVETLRPPAEADDVRRRVKAAVYDELGLTLRSVELAPRGWLVKTTSGKVSRFANLERLRSRRSELVT